MDRIVAGPGKPLPLGATPDAKGTNFSLFSRHGEGVTLLLFEAEDSTRPSAEFELDAARHRTGDVWHVHLSGVGEGALYGYRVRGRYLPEKGLRFNDAKLLIDPYAKALSSSRVCGFPEAYGYDPSLPDGDLSYSAADSAPVAPKCVVVDDAFDWQGDRPLNYPLRFSVLYEAHVRGLTMGRGSAAAHPGSFRGVVESIPYLKELGVTSLELLPVQEFDEMENVRTNPRTGERLKNYWGYSTVAFFAPKGGYSSAGTRGGQVREFKEMVKALHVAGIELILDIVFNHTAEGNELGPTCSFRGLDNPIYYMLEADKRRYKNYSGCGNTLNCNHPAVRSLIIDCLRYWVVEMHVDGFRFDLGSILGRAQDGSLLENPPILERIAEDPVLRDTKIIAEAWDAGGAYQVGGFPGGRWAEWNDRFRDDVRRFWRGDPGAVQGFATRITGSSDLYLRDGRKPFHSINFIASHDGFTLADLVSYAAKHNEENGEGNLDGQGENWSCNHGFEGPASNPAIAALRERQARNFMASLLLSLGTPMILGGDEFLRSQGGNNNAYCQDNPTSWHDWDLARRNAGFLRFVRELVAFRKRHPALHRPEFFTGKDSSYNAIPDIAWYDAEGKAPDWARIDRLIAARMDGGKADTFADRDDNDFYFAFNASDGAVAFVLPPAPAGKDWLRAIDTGRPPPEDILPPGREARLEDPGKVAVGAKSMVVLISR